MRCLEWNSQGLGNPVAVRELRNVTKQEGPSLLFVMETKISAKRVESLKATLGFAGCYAVDSNGLSGGIGLFWTADISIDLKNYSFCHIDVMVRKAGQTGMAWRFTGFYGAPRAEDRHHSWRCLRTLSQIQHSEWLCMGDFNETLLASEHFSRAARPEWQMRAFREAVEDCSLHDLGWSGVEYTWDNKRQGAANVKARLDRAFGNDAFVHKFVNMKVRHIVTTESDHNFVLLDFCENLVDGRAPANKQFRYEDAWQTHADYDRLVLEKWQSGSG